MRDTPAFNPDLALKDLIEYTLDNIDNTDVWVRESDTSASFELPWMFDTKTVIKASLKDNGVCHVFVSLMVGFGLNVRIITGKFASVHSGGYDCQFNNIVYIMEHNLEELMDEIANQSLNAAEAFINDRPKKRRRV